MSDTKPLVKIAPNNPIFDLPVLVGIEEGLFVKAGLDVRMSAPYEAREKDSAERPIMSRLKENQFDCGSADSYNVCEWARHAYYAAENEAVDLINRDFYKYAHHVSTSAKGALQPHELLRAFVRYKHVDYYDATLFDRTYDWMKSRGLTEGSEHATLVVG
jgi:hypothetical protein